MKYFHVELPAVPTVVTVGVPGSGNQPRELASAASWEYASLSCEVPYGVVRSPSVRRYSLNRYGKFQYDAAVTPVSLKEVPVVVPREPVAEGDPPEPTGGRTIRE